MGWFSGQIRQRTESDRSIVEDFFFSLAGAILEKWDTDHLKDHRLIAKDALDEVLKYFHLKPVEIRDDFQDIRKEVDSLQRSTGLMVRDVA